MALPIEQQVNGVDKMLYMGSTSASDGTYSLTVTFAIGTDPNIDQVLVQNRVQLALASLPEPVQAQGVSVQKKNTAILQIVTLDSPTGQYDSLFISNYATINLVDELERLPGVGSVKVFGAGDICHAHLDGPAEAPVIQSRAEGCDRRDPAAEPECCGRAGRDAAGSERRPSSSTPSISSHA